MMWKSNCCNQRVYIEAGSADFIDYKDDEGLTRYFVCSKCNEPCDVSAPNNPIQYLKIDFPQYAEAIEPICNDITIKLTLDDIENLRHILLADLEYGHYSYRYRATIDRFMKMIEDKLSSD